MQDILKTAASVAIYINVGLWGFGFFIASANLQFLALANIFLLSLAFINWEEK